MDNEKKSVLTKSKTLSKNMVSGSLPELQLKAQTNELSMLIDLKKKNRSPSPKRRKRKKQKPLSSLIHKLFKPEIFFANEKIKNNFLNCFNIKELIILLDVNSTFFEIIIQSECFQKYLKLRNEFIYKENIFQKILISNNEETINYTLKNKKSGKNINSPEKNIVKLNNKGNNNYENDKIGLNNINSKISQSRVYHEKFNANGIKSPVKLGLNNILTIYPTLAGEKEKQAKEEEIKNNNMINKLLEEDKNKDKIISLKEIKKSIFPPLDYKRLEINSLLKNNAEKIRKLIKKYNLSQLESRIIFNGIIEHLIFMNDINEANDQHPIVVTNLKASSGFNYYIESLLNIDFDEIAKINFSNVLLNSIQVMKTLCFIFHKYSYCLKILILSNNQIDDKCSKLLFPSLQDNKTLSLLDLSHNCISNEGIAFSELFFIDNRSMNTLLFDNNLLGPIGIFSLCSFLRKNQKIDIELLDLGYNGITKEGIIHLVNYLKNNKNKINKLYLGGNYLCDEGIGILSNIFERRNIVKQKEPEEKNDNDIINNKTIKSNKNIHNSMNITKNNNNNNMNNNINNVQNIGKNNSNSNLNNIINNTQNSKNNSNNNLNNIINNTQNSKNNSNNNLNNITNNVQNNYIESNNKISFLDLQNNNLTKKSSKYLCKIISSNSPAVTDLILSKNNLGSETIIKIFDSIKINNTLLSLDLSETQIDEKSIKHISEIIDKEYLLEKLLLTKNNLKKSCGYIKNLLIKKTNIKYLKLTYCKIENNFNLIFQGLAENKMLQILDLSNNNLSLNQELFEDITNTLKLNNTLIKLKLNEVNIDDTAVDYISKGLKENRALRQLYMKNNYLTKKSVKMLIKSIENNNFNTISKIELGGNDGINNKLIQEIEKIIQTKKENESEYNSEKDIQLLDYNKKYDDNLKD